MLYLYVPIIVAGAIGIFVILPAYIYALISSLDDWRIGLSQFNGVQTNEISRRHLIKLISQARNRLDILCGSLHIDLYDQQVADALQSTMQRRPNLRIRILTGPAIDAYTDGSHPVWELYDAFKLENPEGRWQIRHLRDYPRTGQGRHSDGDLFLELKDRRDWHHRPFVTYYRRYVDAPVIVAEWVNDFELKWGDTQNQILSPELSRSVANRAA